MYDNILWLITARSGSKSIVDKNIKMLGEFPLFYYRYLSAKKISPIENICALLIPLIILKFLMSMV